MIAEKLVEACNLLEDELSKKIFDAKVKVYFQGGEDESFDLLYKTYETSRILDLERYPKNAEYVICGAGYMGRNTYRALTHAGYKVRCVLDNNSEKQGKEFADGIKIYSFAYFVSDPAINENAIVVLDNPRLADVFFNELFELGFPQERIYRTKEAIVRTAFGNIYYDLPECPVSEDEVFIDAGSFNGGSSIDFMKAAGNKYKKIYACEPMNDGYRMCEAALAPYKNVEICKVALGSTVGEAHFAQSFVGLMGSRLGEVGDHVETVKIDTIDHILDGAPATFIKMDIEGAELDALKGAEKTLKAYKPKLAISLYHKNEDLYEIPLWLKKAVPEYKFYLRHYSNKRWDLVLYCVAK